MKLEFDFIAGAETKAFLANLTKQIDRLEKLSGIKVAPVKAAPEVEETDTDEDDDFTPKKAVAKAKKAIAKFEEEDEDESDGEEVEEDAEEEDEDFKTPPPASKKAKAKKVTVDDVNDACKARAAATGGKEGRNEVLAILKKKFKTTSVSDLKPEQYAQAIEAMTV